jgi:hypothetical protein
MFYRLLDTGAVTVRNTAEMRLPRSYLIRSKDIPLSSLARRLEKQRIGKKDPAGVLSLTR